MRTLSCLLLLTAALSAQTAETPVPKQQLLWQKLQVEVAQTDRSLDGVLGVAITDLSSGQQLLHNADQVFPTASVIKLAVLAELYHQEEQGLAGATGKARLADLYTLRKEDLVADSDVLGGLTPGVSRVTNRDLATMMTSVSDNSAMNVLIDRVGMENVNALLDSLGLKQTRLHRKMMDLEAARQGRENVSTPREMADLLGAIYGGKVVQKPLADDFFKVLASGRTHYKAFFRASGIPDDVVIAEKEGELEGVRADCGVVFVPGRPFVLCVMTSYLKDERDGEAAISRIAGAAYSYFDRMGRASPYGRIISPRNSGDKK
jgi:beta-lactamase class A